MKILGKLGQVAKRIGDFTKTAAKSLGSSRVSDGLLLAGNLSRHGVGIANDIGDTLGGAHKMRSDKAANVLDKVSRGATLGSYAHRSAFGHGFNSIGMH